MGFLLGTQVFPGGRILTLASARASDSGTYSCVAVSAVGEDRRDVALHVHSKRQPQRLRLKNVGLGGVWPQSKEGWLGVRHGGRRP